MRSYDYIGQRTYFLTILTRARRLIFADSSVVALCREQFQRAAVATAFVILAYCYMPDHMHALVEGRRADSDLREFVKRAKQLSAYHAKDTRHIEVWRPGYFERLVRLDEDRRRYIEYIRLNPVRARLVAAPEDYPHTWFEATSKPDL